MTELGITRHGFVSGRVQGVFFRVETQKMAMKLGLSGWVRNVDDGRVEFLVSGPRSATETMEKWLAIGPPLARVDSIHSETIGYYEKTGFNIVS